MLSLLIVAAAGPLVSISPESGRLIYKPYTTQGDVIPDFSSCGYRSGERLIPLPPVRVRLIPSGADDTSAIQAAVDRTTDGTVQLGAGTFCIGGTITIRHGHVVVAGLGETKTKIIATGNRVRDLFVVNGESQMTANQALTQRITDSYVTVGSHSVRVIDASDLQVGQSIIIRRMGNKAWISRLGMDRIAPRPDNPESTKQWKPFHLDFHRVITQIRGSEVQFDAPITCSIDSQWGGGFLIPATDQRIEEVGVEQFSTDSEYDERKTAKDRGRGYFCDEAHAQNVVRFVNVKNSWARHIASRFYYHGGVKLEPSSQWVTVEDCRATDPVSMLTGERRYPFNNSGQLNLVQNCYARDARHAFVVGDSHVCGPNVFLHCQSESDHASSEPHQRWSVGGLYDNVSAFIALQDRQYMGTGHGWSGANFVVWNCSGKLVLQQPPTAQNFAFGFMGSHEKSAFPRTPGYSESEGTVVQPQSLYQEQLSDRLAASQKGLRSGQR